jgi:SAM-dependent methyltransferase
MKRPARADHRRAAPARAATDPTRRFSHRVDDYVRYRPHYPPAVLDLLRAGIGLTPRTVVADVGAGPGIAAELFLTNGNPVWAVEPNPEMRAAAERRLGGRPGFHSIDGTAEATTLPDASIDCVVAAQAFHWFDPVKARAEFRRILRAGGWVVLLWNTRLVTTPFGRAYESLLQSLGGDYPRVTREHIDQAVLGAFFAGGFERRTLPNGRTLDFASLRGGLLSASYAPTAGQSGYAPMLAELRRIFDAHQRDGRVPVELETRLYFGRV